MALAEARAAWQRTANRCLVQEDAKRAPKLACCSPCIKQADNGLTSVASGQDINHATSSRPFNRNPSYSNLSPNSKWWLLQQPSYGYQKGSMDEQFNSMGNDIETYQNDNQCKIFEEEVLVGCEVSKKADEVYFDSEPSWVGAEKKIPWWRNADTEELALLVARRSLDDIENCDLPRPQNTRVKKDFGRDGISNSLLDSKPGVGKIHHKTLADDLLVLSGDKPLRDSPTHKRNPEMHASENDSIQTQLLEALCHSQTRAREAEKAAKQACAEKEHVVKLVFKQASHLFAYKQWLHLLQLENMNLQFKNNNKSRSVSIVFPIILPWTSHRRSRKMRTSWQKSFYKKRVKRCYHRCDVSKYAVVFAVGLGLVGAGLLLGWTVGWMIPKW